MSASELRQVEKLCKKNRERAIQLYSKKCMQLNDASDPNGLELNEWLHSFIRHIPEEGYEILTRYRDAIPHLKGEILDKIINIIKKICQNSDIRGYDRLLCAITLYNNYYYDICYICFGDIAADDNVLYTFRVEACRFLVASEQDENVQLAQECLLAIIADNSITSKLRYEIIAGYLTNTGIATVLNRTRLRVIPEPHFVFGLQSAFFQDATNDILLRILSGQSLLQIECTPDSVKDNIVQFLFDVAKNIEFDEDTRANAADVVLRLGNPSQVETARNIINDLGYATVNTGKTILDRIKTVYSTSQNVHSKAIDSSVAKFIRKIIKENNNPMNFEHVHNSITQLIRERKIKPESRIKILKALNRVSIDSATFTENRVTNAEILVHVWMKILSFSDESRVTLQSRLLEELIEMSDSCSSGYAARFVNVLSGFDNDLTISFGEQISANLNGRIQARIRDLDENTRSVISCGMMDEATEKERREYIKFMSSTLLELYDELSSEFVPKYITENEFKTYFEEARRPFILV